MDKRFEIQRDDLSDRLIHLTRGDSVASASARFLDVLASSQLIGGSTSIRGGYRCLCFSEAPLAKLSHSLALPADQGIRYRPFGVMVSKLWLFQQGGRPVFYQPEREFELLPEELRYRHVRYEPDRGVDFSWEREWRIRAEAVVLDPAQTTVIVPTRHWADDLREQWAARDFRARCQIGLTRFPLPMSAFPWHFIALEDLGVAVSEK